MRLNALLSYETLRIGETNFEGSYYSGREKNSTKRIVICGNNTMLSLRAFRDLKNSFI